MGYVDSHLLNGEVVEYRTKLHKIIFLVPAAITLVASYVIYFLKFPIIEGVPLETIEFWGLIGILFCMLWTLHKFIQYLTSEFAVTNRRVILKTGVIQRRIKEILIRQVEGIDIDQSILGRILQYGDVSVSGTGGSQEPFRYIAHPIAFRQFILEEANKETQTTDDKA